jgi:hypothetical protein
VAGPQSPACLRPDGRPPLRQQWHKHGPVAGSVLVRTTRGCVAKAPLPAEAEASVGSDGRRVALPVEGQSVGNDCLPPTARQRAPLAVALSAEWEPCRQGGWLLRWTSTGSAASLPHSQCDADEALRRWRAWWIVPNFVPNSAEVRRFQRTSGYENPLYIRKTG